MMCTINEVSWIISRRRTDKGKQNHSGS